MHNLQFIIKLQLNMDIKFVFCIVKRVCHTHLEILTNETQQYQLHLVKRMRFEISTAMPYELSHLKNYANPVWLGT